MTNCAAARVAAAKKTADNQSAPEETGRSNKQKTFENGEATKCLQADKSFPPSVISSSCSAIFPNYVMRLRSKKFNFSRKRAINTYKRT